MEVKGEEERRLTSEDEEKDSLLSSPCSIFEKAVEAILKCLGLESSTSEVEEEVPAGTETVEETGFMAKIIGSLRRRPKPPYSSGRPGQIN